MSRIKCVETECETKLFTVGKVYLGFDYNDHIDTLQTIKDDLGHSKHINIEGKPIRFVIGHSSGDLPRYAIFQLLD